MTKLTITYKDYINCSLQGLDEIDRKKCYDAFRIFVPTARYTPQYKLGRWDGYTNYYTLTGQTYVNLLPHIFNIINVEKYDIDVIKPENMIPTPEFELIDENYLSSEKWGKGHRLEGQPVVMFDHQVAIVNQCLQNPRSIIEAATGAGKTLISVALAKQVCQHGRFIIIEPSKDLTLQTAQVFKDLGLDVGIVGLGMREFDHKVLVCTWQTINSLERSKSEKALTINELEALKKDVVGILFDECHQCKSYHLQKICNTTFKDLPIKWGLTGTIPKDKCDRYALLTSLGDVVHHLDSKELQEKGILASCNIKCIRLHDNSMFMDYQDEVEYLSTNKDRINFVAELLAGITKSCGNTLVLVNRISLGEDLDKLLKIKGVDSVFLSGAIKSKKRFDEYNSIKTENNRCLIATAQIASTGLDIPRLFNLVLLDIGKSFVRVIQSIGRGLRIGIDKKHVDIYDICSDTKFSKKHFNDRVHYYEDKKFPYQIMNIDTWK